MLDAVLIDCLTLRAATPERGARGRRWLGFNMLRPCLSRVACAVLFVLGQGCGAKSSLARAGQHPTSVHPDAGVQDSSRVVGDSSPTDALLGGGRPFNCTGLPPIYDFAPPPEASASPRPIVVWDGATLIVAYRALSARGGVVYVSVAELTQDGWTTRVRLPAVDLLAFGYAAEIHEFAVVVNPHSDRPVVQLHRLGPNLQPLTVTRVSVPRDPTRVVGLTYVHSHAEWSFALGDETNVCVVVVPARAGEGRVLSSSRSRSPVFGYARSPVGEHALTVYEGQVRELRLGPNDGEFSTASLAHLQAVHPPALFYDSAGALGYAGLRQTTDRSSLAFFELGRHRPAHSSTLRDVDGHGQPAMIPYAPESSVRVSAVVPLRTGDLWEVYLVSLGISDSWGPYSQALRPPHRRPLGSEAEPSMTYYRYPGGHACQGVLWDEPGNDVPPRWYFAAHLVSIPI